VTSSAAFLERVEYISQCSDRLFDFCIREKPLRKLSKKRFMGKQRTLREMSKEFVCDEEPVLIILGDYAKHANAAGIRTLRAPVIKFAAVLQSMPTITVVFYDEYRTSKLCHNCHHVLAYRYSHVHDKLDPETKQRLKKEKDAKKKTGS
jgi:RNase H-fold protein (predicted Holliday junction resolvase)